MAQYGWPVLFVILLWWFSTGAVLWLSMRPRHKLPLGLLSITIVAAIGFASATIAANSAQTWAPYVGFASALAIWAWVEFTFLTGLITGPRTKTCPQNISEPVRFRLAFRTISRHEFALLIALLAVFLITYAGTDHTAVLTFLTLWVMRVSAKLTIFSGVPAFSKEIMPESIRHLHSYFREDRIGPVFWFSTLVCTLLLCGALYALAFGLVPPDRVAQAVLLTTLVALAAFEHWMMVLPFEETALWKWAISSNSRNLGIQRK